MLPSPPKFRKGWQHHSHRRRSRAEKRPRKRLSRSLGILQSLPQSFLRLLLTGFRNHHSEHMLFFNVRGKVFICLWIKISWRVLVEQEIIFPVRVARISQWALAVAAQFESEFQFSSLAVISNRLFRKMAKVNKRKQRKRKYCEGCSRLPVG